MKYSYRFIHKKHKFILILQADSDQEAFIKIGSVMQTVMDWDFGRIKNKKKKKHVSRIRGIASEN